MATSKSSSKACTRCSTVKELGEFYVVKRTGKPHSWCKACVLASQAERYRRAVEAGVRGTGRRLGLVVNAEGRTCADCRVYKPRAEFHANKRAPFGMNVYCKTCWSIRQKVQYGALSKDSDRYRRRVASATAARRRLRLRVFEAYGSACACCGETEPKFLTVDHVNNDGAEHRRVVGRSDYMLRDIVKRGFPPDFQLLCWNCNGAKGAYGECPHETARREAA